MAIFSSHSILDRTNALSDANSQAIIANGVTEKEREYLNYIAEHRSNVAKVYMFLRENYPQLGDYDELERSILNHDISKYQYIEFEPYRRNFFYSEEEGKPLEKDKEAMENAWMHHKAVNNHHMEYFDLHVVDVNTTAILHCVIDLCSMSMKFGGNPYDYFKKDTVKKFKSERLKKVEDTFHTIFRLIEKINWQEV